LVEAFLKIANDAEDFIELRHVAEKHFAPHGLVILCQKASWSSSDSGLGFDCITDNSWVWTERGFGLSEDVESPCLIHVRGQSVDCPWKWIVHVHVMAVD